MAKIDFSHVNVEVKKKKTVNIIDKWFEEMKELCNEKPYVTQLEAYKLMRGEDTILTEDDIEDNDIVYVKDPFSSIGFMKARKVEKFGTIVYEQIL